MIIEFYNDDRIVSKVRENHDYYILEWIMKKYTNDLLCTPKD